MAALQFPEVSIHDPDSSPDSLKNRSSLVNHDQFIHTVYIYSVAQFNIATARIHYSYIVCLSKYLWSAFLALFAGSEYIVTRATPHNQKRRPN